MRASDRETAQAQAQAAWAEQLQQRVMRLEMENRELRRQLDELRRGVGIAVLIQGRPIALASQPPAMPNTGIGQYADVPATGLTGARPAVNPQMGAAPQSVPWPQSMPSPASLMPGPRSRVPSMPLNGPRSYAPEMWSQSPSQLPDHGPRSAPFSEELWLTGRQRAVQVPRPSHAPVSPIAPIAPYAQPAPFPPSTSSTPWQRPETPSQRVTPDWLRDPSPSMPLPSVPPTPTPHYTPAPMPTRQEEIGQPSRRNRSGSAARPLRGARLEPADVPSLAQLTGKHAAVRPSGQRADGDRNPYADSFVLD